MSPVGRPFQAVLDRLSQKDGLERPSYRESIFAHLLSHTEIPMVTSNFNSQIGRDQFMELLVTQLRNQDPLEPVNQQDFLGQLAQFSSLQGIEQLNTNFAESLKFQQLSQGGALVGRSVEYTNAQGEPKTGLIDSARVLNGELRFQIGEDTVGLSDIAGVIRNA